MHRFISRQPILDRHEGVYGYELLFRHEGEETSARMNGCTTGEESRPGTVNFEGIEDLADGTRAFVKCTREALMGGAAAALPHGQVVLEVQAAGEPDEEVVKACRALKEAGFLIALENFHGVEEDPLADVANIIKLDVTASSDRTQWLLIRKFRPKGTVFLADKVENRAQFHAAVQQGYSYFQGRFFLKPQPYATSDVTPTKLVYLLVLAAVSKPEIDVQEIANTIKHDLALSYKLLRFLNSARFAFHAQIKSIRHALLMLGQNEIRKWIGLISVSALGEGSPPILVTMALVRGAFCEYLAPLTGASKRQSDYFFLGLLSSIDVLLRRPIRVILAELPIAPDISAALAGEQNPLRDVLQAVLSYEQGNWQEFSDVAKKLAMKEETLSELYLQALHWSRDLAHAGKGEPAEVKCS
jgi:EAL and modified HD-GYP domain-containing signal transduction protein